MANINAIPNTAPQVAPGNGMYDSYKPSTEGDSFQDMMQQATSAEDAGTKDYGPQTPGLAKPVKPETDQSEDDEKGTNINTAALALYMLMDESPAMPEILDVQPPVQTSEVKAAAGVQQPVTSQPEMADPMPTQMAETDLGSSGGIQIQPEIVETTQDYINNTSMRPQEDSYEQALKSLQAERKTAAQESTATEKASVQVQQPVEQKLPPRQQEQSGFSMDAKTSGEAVVKESQKSAEGESEIEILDLTRQTTLSDQPMAKDVEVVHIKVAEPFREVNQNMMRQVSQTIQETVQSGKQEVVIQLNPEHLGKIAIKITMMDDGIKVALNCDNAKTQSLMAEKAAGIGKIVEENMNAPVTVEVKDGGYWNQQKDAADQHARQQHRQQERQTQENTDEFIQQLRLGLVSQQIAG